MGKEKTKIYHNLGERDDDEGRRQSIYMIRIVVFLISMARWRKMNRKQETKCRISRG